MAAFVSLLASAVPTWTDKEVLIAFGRALAVVIPVAVVLVQLYFRSTRRNLRLAQARVVHLENRVDDLSVESKQQSREIDRLRCEADAHPTAEVADLSHLEKQIEQARRTAQELAQNLESTDGEKKKHREEAAKLKTELDALAATHRANQEELTATTKRIERALKSEGPIWTEKVRYNTPEFKPLDGDERRTPIISVLNLKGGVGKTTIAANLGACLDGQGYRTLMLDLDLQGSLTNMFLSEKRQEELYDQKLVLGDFLNRSFDAEHPNLLGFTHPILPDGKSSLVPTADNLAYAEMNLSVRWLLREGTRDPRFLLRKELHLKRITNAYDMVVLDCPPLLNIFCVNAIAASDYLLIPIVPSRQSMTRVPVLLSLLKEFQEHINPKIKVLGIVTNRSHRADPTTDESNLLSQLRTSCLDVWGAEVNQFETLLRQSPEFRMCEDEKRPLRLGDSMYQSFATLTGEIIDRLPTFCTPTAKKPVSNAEVTV